MQHRLALMVVVLMFREGEATMVTTFGRRSDHNVITQH
jgi:hypothetical protein